MWRRRTASAWGERSSDLPLRKRPAPTAEPFLWIVPTTNHTTITPDVKITGNPVKLTSAVPSDRRRRELRLDGEGRAGRRTGVDRHRRGDPERPRPSGHGRGRRGGKWFGTAGKHPCRRGPARTGPGAVVARPWCCRTPGHERSAPRTDPGRRSVCDLRHDPAHR